ncbi:MAG: PD-(D/E)XK nuclease-like domain-containing protein [Opitutaceae bacterium]
MSANAIHIDCQAAEYHARPEWSQSQWKLLPDHPELFYGMYIEPDIEKRWKFKATEDMELGTQLHGVWLEKKELLIIPYTALTSNGQRRGRSWEAWCEEHPEDHGILEKDSLRIRDMLDRGLEDPVVRSLMEAEGETEHTIVWTDEETGLPLRCRIDKLCRFDGGYQIADIKCTSADVTDEREIASKIFSFGYHQQAAAYMDAATLLFGERPLNFVFVFVRNKPPYNAVAWTLPELDIELGKRHNRVALIELQSRLACGNWHGGRFGKLNTVSLPKWAWTDDPLGLPMSQPFSEFNDYE